MESVSASFALFCRLPIELRFQIWELVDFPPVATIRISNSSGDWKVRNAAPIPGVLSACRESRMLTLPNFQPYFTFIGCRNPRCTAPDCDRTVICFNPKRTVLELSICDSITYERDWPLKLTRDCLAQVIGKAFVRAEHLHVQCDDLQSLWEFWGRGRYSGSGSNLGWNKGIRNVTESTMSFEDINAARLQWCSSDFKLSEPNANVGPYFTARKFDINNLFGLNRYWAQFICKDSGRVTPPLSDIDTGFN
ncbi:hypothetical protein BDV96DRAFT_156624 [Lophiotrema nucula]|uniref:2EXR domain-containing protein n=1 Tax=Lophiotrema nucula TaxID=690887 RepID=A0A6A5Z144_9PLEO|nr:hypothetical protein BDV96DRAFT_156624 [Lophiotrema nucula]